MRVVPARGTKKTEARIEDRRLDEGWNWVREVSGDYIELSLTKDTQRISLSFPVMSSQSLFIFM